MRHNWILLLCLLSGLQAAAAQNKAFTLKGDVKGLPDQYIYLAYAESTGKYKEDSVMTRGGKFTFTGELSQPVEAQLYVGKANARYGVDNGTSFFIEPGTMQVRSATAKLKEAKLTGSKVQLEKDELEAMSAPVTALLNPLREAYEQSAPPTGKTEAEQKLWKDKMEKLKAEMEPHYEAKEKIDKAFIHKYPNSYISAQLLRYTVDYIPLKEGEAYYARMSPAMQQSMDGKEIKKSLDGLRAGSPGSVAHIFAKQDIDGKMLNLSDFKGQYVLLDFWASWCGPCRKGNPHLKELYGKYKDKGFEIIGIADDDSFQDKWKMAVAQDGIGIWRQVLGGLDMESRMKNLRSPQDIGTNYGIHTLPTKILIDPQGMIVGRYGSGGEEHEALDEKLKEIFGK